jgi:hypothetical protein
MNDPMSDRHVLDLPLGALATLSSFIELVAAQR